MIDLEAQLPTPSATKLSLNGTPLSQATTAPCTPFHGGMLEPLFFEDDVLQEGLPHCMLRQGTAETCISDDWIRQVTSETTWSSDINSDEELASCWLPFQVSMPPLQSELGKWAEHIVQQEEGALQSELGKWAEQVVQQEDWTQEFMRSCCSASKNLIAAEYVVDNSELQAKTDGLGYRSYKSIDDHSRAGAPWGTSVVGTDEGDGWVRVGEYYLPMVMNGARVLIRQEALCFKEDALPQLGIDDIDPMWDGAALTIEGRVLDLDGGRAVFFAFDKVSSLSFEASEQAKQAARRRRVSRQTQLIKEAAARILADDIFSIDEDGLLHGMPPLMLVDVEDKVARLKLHHRKRWLQLTKAEKASKDSLILCATIDGQVFIYLNVDSDTKPVRQWMAHQKTNRCKSNRCTMAMDANGTIQDVANAE